ncbi:hypothetical protein QNH14_15735 [Apirhabdus apintestini]|nr:hypothetical protein QNH14_15735 [Enterobacteriaceae bacterium CA-0114]
MSIPLFLHLEGNTGIDSDQRLGNAFIWLEGDGLKLRRIQREENEHVATLLPTVVSQLTTLKDVDFNDRLRIELDDEVWCYQRCKTDPPQRLKTDPGLICSSEYRGAYDHF